MKYNKHSHYTLMISTWIVLISSLQLPATPQPMQPDSIDPKSAVEQLVITAGCTELPQEKSGDNCSASKHRATAMCFPKRVTKDVEETCWKVKQELICIPSFQFNFSWCKKKQAKGNCDEGQTRHSSAGTATCGRVRCINVLEKHKYTCQECGYEWEIKCVCQEHSDCRKSCRCPKCQPNQ